MLWCIYIPGPCDVYAAPSKEAAEHMAEQHNSAMTAYLEGHPELLDRWGVTLESIKAEVRAWDHGKDEHSEELAEFNADEWGWDLANNCAKAEEPSAKGGKHA